MWFGSGSGGNANAATTTTTTTANNNNNNNGATTIDSPTKKQQQQQPPTGQLISTTTTTAATTTTSSTVGPEKISFNLKTSIFKRKVTLDSDKINLGLIKQLAFAFLSELYFQDQYPIESYIGDYLKKNQLANNIERQSLLYDRLLLRKYDPKSDSFVPFNSAADIEPESYISVEISEKPIVNLLSSGVITHSSGSQVLVSSIVDQPESSNSTDFHNSYIQMAVSSNSNNSSNLSTATAASNSSSVASSSNHQHQLKISHDFKQETFMLPTYCASCTALIKGVFRQGYQCVQCRRNFCSKCKLKAEKSGDSCLTPGSATTLLSANILSSLSSSSSGGGVGGNTDNITNSSLVANNDSSDSTSNSQSNNSQQQQQQLAGSSTPGKLDILHLNMIKRKSASNLLHFNIANPFKSHHNNNNNNNAASTTAQTTPNSGSNSNQSPSKEETKQHSHPKTRSSAGGLEPVLQQLSKSRFEVAQDSLLSNSSSSSHQQQQVISAAVMAARGNTTRDDYIKIKRTTETAGGGGNSLLVAQTTHLSSSHQNLFSGTGSKSGCGDGGHNNKVQSGDEQKSDKTDAQHVDSGIHQVSTSPANKCQLSNSARNSAHDLYAHLSPTRPRDPAYHTFISMDWIQIKGDPNCGVCNKPLNSSNPVNLLQHQQAPAMCKSCKLQVHAHCHTLVLTDCMSRIAEASRAAAARLDSSGISASSSSSAAVAAATTAAAANSNNNTKLQDDNKEANNNNNKEQSRARIAVKSSTSNASRDNIRLHRLAPSVKNIKRPDAMKPIIEGWLKHTTLADEQTRQHYWRLDETDITLFENATSKRYFRAIPVSSIARVMSASSLPKRIREDVLLANNKQLCPAQQQQQQQQLNKGESSATCNSDVSSSAAAAKTTAAPFEPSGSGKPRSANATPTKTPELLAQMKAMFAFEQATGSMYLVQAESESEASRWREQLAAITGTDKRPSLSSDNQSEQRTAAAAAAPPDIESAPVVKDSDKPVVVETTTQQQQDEHRQKPQEQQPEQRPLTQAGQTMKPLPLQPLPEQQQPQVVATAATAAPEKTDPPETKRPPQRQHHHHHHYPPSSRQLHHTNKSTSAFTDPNRSRLYNRPRITINLNPMNIPDHLVGGRYLIERDRQKGVGFEELGSGQFGKVYAAISDYKAEDNVKSVWSGVPVAIKEISKARFDLRQQAKLKNEANILSRLDHPGVIILERVHDYPDKIYIVMEQLEDDMLEMIVSTEEKRLNERITKFLTYQILEALKYLHSQNIAHCDLKPENVLLVERRSQFPQIKLCDFGFAKIIEDNSFRSSLVGTPAYLAPEVVKGERYNRSVDLWSVGVIVYVSLSGEFPFNEGESIHDQISRASFMWPDQIWAKISAQAKNFINSLLRVNSEKRLSASRAQMDDWFQDYQLWCDLSELEVRVGRRWVTDNADFERWSKYAKKHNLQLPRSAIQLHEELIAD